MKLLVYDMERNEVHCLNGSAARVWALCDGERTVSEIARLLGSDLEPRRRRDSGVVRPRPVRREASARRGQDDPPDLHRPADMTRRQMVLRLALVVGLLPVVDSIMCATRCAGAVDGAPGCTPQPTGTAPGMRCTNMM